MKSMSMAVVTVALLGCPAVAADERYQSTMTGDVTIKVVPVDPATGAAQPQSGEDLTIRFAPPPKRAAGTQNALWEKLRSCGKKWNDKLRAYEEESQTREAYLAYYDKWKDHPAQRPPKSSEPILTRASYRACIYQCLDPRQPPCPGGWPPPKK